MDRLEGMKESIREFMENSKDILCCPRCEGEICIRRSSAKCFTCGQEYPIEGDIPLMFWPNEWRQDQEDVTEIVKSFYEARPFPNYDDWDSPGSLIEKAKRSAFVSLLDEQVPFGTVILEVGCGTGQLTNFLGISNRTVFGTDISLNALQLGQRFKEKNKILGSHFLQMNLFRPAFKRESFDLVYCTGVLHHTSDPFGGFRSISRLVRPGGYIVIGLYHRFGRIIHDLRRFIINNVGRRAMFLDPRLRSENKMGKDQWEAWFLDQYRHPHESKHTMSEVSRWFRETGFDFVKSIPKTKLLEGFRRNERLFKAEPGGNWCEWKLVEWGMVFSGGKEGGYFMVIGRKKSTDGGG